MGPARRYTDSALDSVPNNPVNPHYLTDPDNMREVVDNSPPLPSLAKETAAQKARMAENAWNSRDPAKVLLAYAEDSRWRNRAEFMRGREAIQAFLTRERALELDKA